LIDGEVARAEDVISNLLSYGSNKEIAFLQIEIGDVIHDFVTGIFFHENVELSMEVEPNLPSILGDSSQLIRALQNLLVNAQDAMQDSGRNGGCLSVKAHRIDGTVEIVVADNGSGISPENLENIFEPLYTAKAQGTGLGLVICQEIINKHSGTISVDNEIGVGTTFRISISFAVKDESGSKIPISV
jgi:signal transduction histidine kinase|tara:strand:+ start:693 stop:1253 length:561 start_codon:yes stop_codon:yes gene_type:complete